MPIEVSGTHKAEGTDGRRDDNSVSRKKRKGKPRNETGSHNGSPSIFFGHEKDLECNPLCGRTASDRLQGGLAMMALKQSAALVWPQYRKALMGCAGALYILFGLLAFFGIPGGHEDHHHTFAHNVTHLLLGAILLIVAWTARPTVRQIMCCCFAAGYFFIAMIGRMAGTHSSLPFIPGLIEFHAGDYAVHFATSVVFLVLALLRRSDANRTSPI